MTFCYHLPAAIVIKPAFGMYYVYFEGKIGLIFRKVNKNPQHNGIWIAARREDHVSLEDEMPAVTDFIFKEDEAFEPNWLQLTDVHEDFEKRRSVSVRLFPGGTSASASPPPERPSLPRERVKNRTSRPKRKLLPRDPSGIVRSQ